MVNRPQYEKNIKRAAFHIYVLPELVYFSNPFIYSHAVHTYIDIHIYIYIEDGELTMILNNDSLYVKKTIIF